MEDKSKIIEDFDRIAALQLNKWDHNRHYHDYLLKHMPKNSTLALDIGCGAGEFTRLLAERCEKVQGIDLSPEMIRSAKEQSSSYKNIEYYLGDVLEFPLEENSYDCIASVAVMHHLPLEEVLRKSATALRKNGTLMILDLYETKGTIERFYAGLAVPVNLVMMLLKTGRLRPDEEARKAWDEHGKSDRYMTLEDIGRISAKILPGAKVKRHFFWRYSLIWKKQ